MTEQDLQQVQAMINAAIDTHTHTGTNANGSRLAIKSIFKNAPQSSITDVTGTADGTYSSNEQNLINDEKITINLVLTTLRNLGLINP